MSGRSLQLVSKGIYKFAIVYTASYNFLYFGTLLLYRIHCT